MYNFLLSIISGLFTGLSFDFSGFSFFVWFSLVPFLKVVSSSNLRKGIFYSFCFSFVYSLVSIFWVGKVTMLGLFLLLVYLSFYTILFFIIGRYFIKKPLAILTIPALWVLVEFLKENIWCGFGWLNLGYSQYRNLYLIQPADLFGVKFISFVIVAVNVLLWEIISRRALLLRKAAFVAFIVFASLGYSIFSLNNLKSQDTIPLAIVQPNVAEEIRLEESSHPDIIEKLTVLSQKTGKDSLVIFPEAAWPPTVCEANFSQLSDFAKNIKRNILIGAVILENGNFYNTAMSFSNSAKLQAIYRKVRIVPFGEYVPLRKVFSFISAINAIGDMSRGTEQTVFSFNNKKFSVPICFEDVFPLFSVSLAKRSDFLVNITNDAWFGGQPQASQHLAIMALRAIENRISIARSANTGISGWVSYRGDIHSLKSENEEIFVDGVLNFNLPLNGKRSLYNKWGEVFIAICFLLMASVVLVFK